MPVTNSSPMPTQMAFNAVFTAAAKQSNKPEAASAELTSKEIAQAKVDPKATSFIKNQFTAAQTYLVKHFNELDVKPKDQHLTLSEISSAVLGGKSPDQVKRPGAPKPLTSTK